MLFKKLDLPSYWNEKGLSNIKPMSLRYGEHPEGWNPVHLISRFVIPLIAGGSVVEIGCGYGRLCQAFDPLIYLGLDINKNAIKLAKEINPGHKFKEIEFVDKYPPAEAYFAYTVFLHIDDKSLKRLVGAVTNVTDKVIVAEILSNCSWLVRRFRKIGSLFSSHPYFPRNRNEYVNLFKDFGFALSEELKKPYHFYLGTEISFLVFERLSPLPMSLSGFPECLRGRERIEADGLYDDGWIKNRFKLRLRSEGSRRRFHFSALIPNLNGKKSARIAIKIDNKKVLVGEFPGGEFQYSKILEIKEGDHLIEINVSPLIQLSSPDDRRATVLLRQIGFFEI